MLSGILPEIAMGLSSLFVHKMRSMLTMLGMIFGVGAVVAMLSITEGAKKDILASIEVLGVNNILIEARDRRLRAIERQEALRQQRKHEAAESLRQGRIHLDKGCRRELHAYFDKRVLSGQEWEYNPGQRIRLDAVFNCAPRRCNAVERAIRSV